MTARRPYDGTVFMAQVVDLRTKGATAIDEAGAIAFLKANFDLLKGILPPGRAGQLVSLTGFLQVRVWFARRALTRDVPSSYGDPRAIRYTLSRLGQAHIETETVLQALSEVERANAVARLMGLNEEMRELFDQGELTYADLIARQPEAFVPHVA